MTANPEEGQVDFDAGGKTYVLEITNRTERAIQKRVGKNLSEVVGSLAKGDAEALFAVFYESLKKHQPDIKEAEVEELVKPRELRKLVSDLLEVTYPVPPEPGQEGIETGSANSQTGSS
jgi:ATP-dependent protease HslVU (ClpYQ) peptidase subunit